jgi:hypothetical protein
MIGRHRFAFGFLTIALGIAAAASPGAQGPSSETSNAGIARSDWAAERSADGHPDFQGVWANNTVTPLQRPKQWEGKTRLTDAHENLHLTERLTRVGPEILNYEFTVDDPTMWTAPWTGMIPLKRKSELIYEYACHEGNESIADMLRGHRFEEREGGTSKR